MLNSKLNTNQSDSHFDFAAFEEEAIEQLMNGEEVHNIIKPLLRTLINKALEGEREFQLEHHKNTKSSNGNYKNGHNKKTVKSSVGNLEVNIPRDRKGEFEPNLIKKYDRKIGNSIEHKILSLYSMGMSYRDIKSHLAELYGLELSEGQLTTITDKIYPEVTEWQNRPLEQVYPFIFMDATFFKVRENGRVNNKAVYLDIVTLKNIGFF